LVFILLAGVRIAGGCAGYALGVAGAVLASSIAVFLGLLMQWVYFRKLERYVVVDRRQLYPQFRHWRRILDIGLPAGAEFAIIFSYMAVVYYALRDFGPAAQAGFGIGTRVLGLIQVPAMAVAFAAGPVAGQNVGAAMANASGRLSGRLCSSPLQ
jgi:Na+-driven multidrug efflux pump